MHYLYILATLGVFCLLGELHGEEYKCCNNSANDFNCKKDYDLLPTAARAFVDHLQASSVCANYPSYKTSSGTISKVNAKRKNFPCSLCRKSGLTHVLGGDQHVCSTCLGNIANFMEPNCSICLEEDDEPIEIFQCKHNIHQACHDSSIVNCPVCRTTISHSLKGVKKSEILRINNSADASEFDEEPTSFVVMMNKRNHQSVVPESPLHLKHRFGVVENGLLMPLKLDELASQLMASLQTLTDQRYVKVALDPEQAKNDHERLAALEAREIFILVDRSLGMSSPHRFTLGRNAFQTSTLWEVARYATTSIVQVASALDSTNPVKLMLWNGEYEKLVKEMHYVSNKRECDQIFRKQSPKGTSELGMALEDLYKTKLDSLLQNGEPFTAIILTASVPNDMNRVERFFEHMTKEHQLEMEGKETRAAFSVINLGSNRRVSEAFNDLKNRLIFDQQLRVDLLEVNHANYLFGVGSHLGQQGVGPFAILWDAIFD